MVGINKKGKMSIIDIIVISENIFPEWWCEVCLKLNTCFNMRPWKFQRRIKVKLNQTILICTHLQLPGPDPNIEMI